MYIDAYIFNVIKGNKNRYKKALNPLRTPLSCEFLGFNLLLEQSVCIAY